MSKLPDEYTATRRWYMLKMETNVFRSKDGWMMLTRCKTPLVGLVFGPDEISEEHARECFEKYNVHGVIYE